MKAMRLMDSTLTQQDVPRPEPGPDDVLVRIHAAGITPTELEWYPTTHMKTGEQRIGAILAHEFSGMTEAGEEVYGMNDWFADGALAEYCVTQPSCIARKPPRLSHAEAAAVPIGALTAWQGLYDHAKLQAGERVLIHGGAGAVGLFAVQLARLRGARVISTASAKNLEFVKDLGAEQVIDYRASRFEDSVRDVDVIFDTVGGETLSRSWNVLKPGGRMVAIAAENDRDERAQKAFFIVEPNGKQLAEIGDLLETGRLSVFVDSVLAFSQAPAAFDGTAPNRRGHGKMVVVVA